MHKHVTTTWTILKEVKQEFTNDKIMKLSASLAYYTIFSLSPMLIVIISLSSIFFGKEAVQGKIYGQLNSFVGNDAAVYIQELIKNVSLKGDTHIATTVGIITLILGATGVFTEIQDSINYIWGVKPKPKRGWLKLFINRALSFSMVVSLSFLLIVSLIISTLLDAFSSKLSAHFPEISVIFFKIFNFGFTFFIITLLFAIIFKVLPDAKIKWRDVTVGSLVTSLLFLLGKLAITFYISYTDMGSAYGAAGSLIIILVWVYYSSVILYFGAEFTHIYAYHIGDKIQPADYAVFIQKTEIERVFAKEENTQSVEEGQGTGKSETKN